MKSMFHLPDLGENIEAGDLVGILVSVGDVVSQDQPLLELETDKAVVEVPAGFSGKVLELHIKEGDRLAVGAAILTYESEAAVEEEAADAVEEAPADSAASREEPQAAVVEEAKPEPVSQPEPQTAQAPAPAVATQATGIPVPASPTVRRLARELGVEIRSVKGSGPAGRISRDDVKLHVKELLSRGKDQLLAGSGSALPAEELPDFSRFGEVERVPLSNVRRATARQMSRSWLLAPRVTQQDKADITHLEELRGRLQKKLDKQLGSEAPRITATAILIKVLAGALRAFPQFNASMDTANDELVLKHYVHIGVAVDTERGLLVPVIRDVDRKGIVEIARELTELSARARARKTSMEEMQGACITLTNLGGIGGTTFTPIVNHPEVAILGVARSSMEPVWDAASSSFLPRLMLPLALSYDHRVIDGADGARFARWISEALEEPLLLAL
jgi:pyruvate dehydrogenase E2 component (dihydrolipoamide acetyltransferase)